MSIYRADEACTMTVGQLISHLAPNLPSIPESAVTMTIGDDWVLVEWDRVMVIGDDGRPEIDGGEIKTIERHGQITLRVDAVQSELARSRRPSYVTPERRNPDIRPMTPGEKDHG